MTAIHAEHIRSNRSHNNCDECRADNEHSFVNLSRWQYSHVHDYLGYIKPRLEAIHAGEDSINARIWMHKFNKALHTRISLKVPAVTACRKYSDGYLERFRGIKHVKDVNYLRAFAARKASTLS